MTARGFVALSLFVVHAGLAACGPAAPPPAPLPGPSAAPPATSAPPPAASSEPPPEAFPSKCAEGTDPCTPGEEWATRVCKLQSADVALALFGKNTPWSRGYLTRDTEAWNAAGGGTARGKLLFDEEVIVLRKRAASGIVQGNGGYDVVRWDGSCASLTTEELTLKRPPRQRTAPLTWKYFDTATRDALSADKKVSAAYDKRRKECKGVTSGDVSQACIKADTALGESIVEYVRGGGALPVPKI
jgi:hypothetical protein